MTHERRNLYRILYVQPEAPPEMITAAYRCLMSRLRAHPDLGGNTEMAARINQAYQVLRDPAKRKAYDESRRRPLSSRTARASDGEVRRTAAVTARACPFCGTAVPARIEADSRCRRCASPLAPIAYKLTATGEPFGRRSAPRVEKNARVTVHTTPDAVPISAVLRDLSATGVSLYTAVAVRAGRNIRIEALGMDMVAHVIETRPSDKGCLARAVLLTALFNRKSGVFMSTSA